jgi:Protein involved in biosynthesis of mitomycin antibiotics/polyketide fumonisin
MKHKMSVFLKTTTAAIQLLFLLIVPRGLDAFSTRRADVTKVGIPVAVVRGDPTARFHLGMASSSNIASGLLYQEQEKMIVSRGIVEEELMSQNKLITELLSPKIQVRGMGSAGGFGGGKNKAGGEKQKGKSNKKDLAWKTEAAEYAKTLQKDGVVRIDNVLSPKLVDRLRKYAYDLRLTSEQEVKEGKVQPIERFADVLLKQNRCDLTIPLGDEIVSDALNQALRESAVGHTISNILSESAVLYELSCLMSDPGSQRQVMHPDTPFIEGKGPVLYTCFIALQDIHLDMGPTTWLPGTHTLEAHEEFMDDHVPKDCSNSRKDILIRDRPAVLGTLTKGSCAIFDSRCLHCGTANQSEQSRALFTFV